MMPDVADDAADILYAFAAAFASLFSPYYADAVAFHVFADFIYADVPCVPRRHVTTMYVVAAFAAVFARLIRHCHTLLTLPSLFAAFDIAAR